MNNKSNCFDCQHYDAEFEQCFTSEENCIRFLPQNNTRVINIQGSIEVPPHITADIFSQQLINWIESQGYLATLGVKEDE